MFERDAIHERGKALEDEFFHRVDEKLRAELRRKMEHDDAVARLQSATGFEDAQLLSHLVDSDFTPASIAVIALVPLVFVAWADGFITPAERQSILSAALHRGIKDNPTAFEVLEQWLHHRPSDSLLELWKEYAIALGQTLTPTLAKMLQQEILRLATAVAQASKKQFSRESISAAEQAVLDKIAEVPITPAQ
ncbi:hypothetical protein N9N28_04650 [Rubripirellula amarantea]|nr:hypothetical protein [Rubripirellula amarantea]